MAVKGGPVKVAIASDFLGAFSRIPRAQQGKVMNFITKFRTDPTMPGIHYETIQNVKDPNLRSVRIDQAYRGIVHKPQQANVYLLLWVDHHDEAYRWARNKVCDIHPDTGSIQIFDVEAEPVAAVPEGEVSAADALGGLFQGLRDRNLVRMGIPGDLLPAVRSIRTEEDLDRAADQFPQEAVEALYMLAAGYSVDEVLRELDRPSEATQVDPGDFLTALENPDTRRRFYVVDDDLDLAAVLNAPLEKWRVFLHPSQRKLVERDWNGPVRVLGGAGTGKTVVAMHRAKWLAENRFAGSKSRILFTTFTRNLAADIGENLGKICADDVMRRIEVVNLDRWVSNFLKRSGYNYEIDYGHRTKALWEKALTVAPAELVPDETFYRDEWEQVIQPQGITCLAEYMKASRVGRGVRLARKDRKAAWAVFEEYRILLDEQHLREGDDAMRDARLLLEKKGEVLPYGAVIVDEAQDMGPQAFRLFRQMIPLESPNDLFIVGDAHQRIYRHRVVLGGCGVNIRGRSRKLRINYRTTEENRRWAVALLEGLQFDDLDGGVDEQKGYKSLLHGLRPEVRVFDSFQQEIDFIVECLEGTAGDVRALDSTCVVARTNGLVKQYEAALEDKGIETYLVRRSEAEDRRARGVRLATMHRVKGLEFDRVIIASANDGVVPLGSALADTADPVARAESEARERALLYVAATRAKRQVLVTGFGVASQFLS